MSEKADLETAATIPSPEETVPSGPRGRNLTNKTLSGMFWMLSGTTAQSLLRMGVLAVTARLLTPADFGVVGVATIFVHFAVLFSQFGLGPALVQRPHIEERHIRTAFFVFTLSGLVIGLGVVAAAPLIAGFFEMPRLTPILQVGAIAFPLQGLGAVPSAMLTRELQFRKLAAVNLASFILGSGVVGITLAFLGFGAWALLLALLSQYLIYLVLLLFAQPFPKLPQFEPNAFRELLYFGGGFTVARLLNYAAGHGDNLVVGRWLGPAALGFYGRAYQMLVFPVNLFGDTLDQVLFASMSRVQDDSQRLALAYKRGISLTALVYLPMSVGLIVLAPEVIYVVLGPAWEGILIPFQILAAGMIFRANKIDHTVARATGAVYRRAWRQGLYAAAVFAGAWIGQRWGITGVSVGVLIALALNFGLMIHLSLRLTSMSWRAYLAAFAPGSLLAAVTFVLVWASATGLRSLATLPVITLVGSSVITGVVLLLLLMLKPQLLLGPDAMWMLGTITKAVTHKVSAIRRRTAVKGQASAGD